MRIILQGSPSLTAEAANAHNGPDLVLMVYTTTELLFLYLFLKLCLSHVDDRAGRSKNLLH